MATWVAIGVGAAVSITSVVVGAVLQTKLNETQRRRERLESSNDARVVRVGGVLGRLNPLVADIPPTLMVWVKFDVVQKIFLESWEPLRRELGVLAATESSKPLRNKLIELEKAVASLFVSLGQLVSPDLREQGREAGETRNFYDLAEERYSKSEQLIREILDEIHRSSEAPPPHSRLGSKVVSLPKSPGIPWKRVVSAIRRVTSRNRATPLG